MYQQPLIPEPNGHHVSTQSEINNNVDHVGLSELLKLFQTDSVLHLTKRLWSSFPQRTWLLVIPLILDAQVDGWTKPGATSKILDLLQINVSHTHLVLVQFHNVKLLAHVLMPLLHMLSINALPTLSLKPQPQIKSNQLSLLMDQLRLHSASIKTSSVTLQEYINTLLVDLPVDTPLKC